ncbi:hypothetical protein RB195_015366 [Necator americanus]|uniref:ZP domain-containing protein n=1 Tax=Necator americanus TaxID=51031 RepID=A0ABR1E5E4_NECAM
MQAPTELPQSTGLMDDRKAPLCRYEVLTKDQNGSPVMFATIGDIVYHKWSCDSDDSVQYCMTVHSCTADDGQGIGQQLIDENGCSLDNFLLKNLDYGDDLVAGQVAHVFKFADKPTIFFACMIRLEIKDDASSPCKHSFDHCKSPSHRSMPVQTPNRVDKVESNDFPKPEQVDQNRPGRKEDGIIDITSTASGDDDYQFVRSQRDTRHALNLDVSAPSLEVIDLPELDTDVDKLRNESPSLREVKICVSRTLLGIGLCLVAILAGVVCIYLALSMKRRKGHLRPQPVPHPDLSYN